LTSDSIRGRILAVCLSETKGVSKDDAGRATLVAGHGLEGDAHAGPWHRQVSLLATSSIDRMRALGLELRPGDFAENLVVEGIDLWALPVGTRLEVVPGPERRGDNDTAATPHPLLEVTQIGKECHEGCAIKQQVGKCIMPTEGIFVRVLRGGPVAVGDELAGCDPGRFVFATVTASDKGSRGEREDVSGRVIAELLQGAGGEAAGRTVLPDEREALEAELRRLSDAVGVDLVLTTGGTGLGPRDVTPEATLAAIDRQVPGIPEAMRLRSLEKTSRAMLSRAVAGTRGRTLIINLPGSPAAVRECLGVVLPALPHGIEVLRGRGGECGR